VRLSLVDATHLGGSRALRDRKIDCVLSAGTQAGRRAVALPSVARGRVAGGGRLHLQPRPLALRLLPFAARVGARSTSHARQHSGERAEVFWPVERPPNVTPCGAAAVRLRRPRLDTVTNAARASWEMGCASVRGAPPRRRSPWGSRHHSRLATRPVTTVAEIRGDGGSWRVRRRGLLCD